MKKTAKAEPKKSASRALKRLWKKSKQRIPLKEFVRSLRGEGDDEQIALVSRWFYNKTTNFSKPTLGLGSTNSRTRRSDRKKPHGRRL